MGALGHVRPPLEAAVPDPTGPQFDPQPGDTMTCPDGYVYTVTSVEGDGDPNHTWVHSTHPDGTSDGGWSLAMWAEDCDGRFVYARPGATG